MQKALLKRRWEASTPTLHRHIVIIIITNIIISVTMMTTCFPSRASAENSKALSHVENFTSFHYSMNAKTFALSTRCASSSFPCRSVHTERRIGFFLFRLLQLPHPVWFVFCVSGRGVASFVADTADNKGQKGTSAESLPALFPVEVSHVIRFMTDHMTFTFLPIILPHQVLDERASTEAAFPLL